MVREAEVVEGCMSTLSVCLIAKNEENNIERCLESIKNIADEIIVVDTGSTDRTVEIAKAHGAKVIESLWENDFSKARNTSLDHATKKWILILDCDEELPKEQGEVLRKLIESSPKEQGFHCRLINVIKGQSQVTAVVLRIFRNDKRYRFEGKMHEQIVKSIVAIHGIESIAAKEITIMHYGYDGGVVSQEEKSRRNLDLLLSYKEEDKDGYYYYALGNEHTRLGAFQEAVSCYKKSYEKTKLKDNRVIYYAYLILHWMNTYYNLGEFQKIIALNEEVEKGLPHFRDLYFITALAYREVGKLWKAQELLEKYLSCQMTYFEYPSNQYGHVDAGNMLDITRRESVKPCVVGCYLLKNKSDSLRDGIKNMNAIAYQTYVLVREEDRERLKETIDEVSKVAVELIYIKEGTGPNDLRFLYPKLREKWLFVLEDDEIMPFTVARLVPELLKEIEAKAYLMTQVDLSCGVVSQSARLSYISKRSDLGKVPQDAKTSYIVIYKKQGYKGEV